MPRLLAAGKCGFAAAGPRGIPSFATTDVPSRDQSRRSMRNTVVTRTVIENALAAPPVRRYRSHSPITKSMLPRMLTTSLTKWPGMIFWQMLRFTNDGARIFNRYGTPPPRL